MNETKRFLIKGDCSASVKDRNILHLYPNTQENEILCVNWRVIDSETGKTMVAFAGGLGYLAAQIVADHLEEECKECNF